MRTPDEIMLQTNSLARAFYAMQGYDVKEGYDFTKATYPTEILAWKMACEAQIMLTSTDVLDVISEMEN